MSMKAPLTLRNVQIPGSGDTTITAEAIRTKSAKPLLEVHYEDGDSWRPQCHVVAPTGWLNDPCAPAYDSVIGLYHLFYQWNPKGPEWDHICWGHATSRDLVHWTHDEQPSMAPSTPYDRLGVFTGCMVGSGPKGEKEKLTIVYTSVNCLPIHYTKPYHRGSESLSLAVSSDRGRTWSRYEGNPILPGPPLDVDVVAWRDPQVFSSAEIDRLLGRPEGLYLYGLICGGIRKKTPTGLLYSVPISDLTRWVYLGPIAVFGLNWKSGRWTRDWGANWEVGNIFSLCNDESTLQRTFLIASVEGGRRLTHWSGPGSSPLREPRWVLWVSGPLQLVDGHPQMEPEISGVLDHGLYYAANTFEDTKHKRRVVWGWILEDDADVSYRRGQGWAGAMSFPREVRYNTIRNVVSALHTSLQDLDSFIAYPDGDDLYKLETLSIIPVEELKALRRQILFQTDQIRSTSRVPPPEISFRTKSWEFTARVSFSPNCSSIGLRIRYGASLGQHVLISFHPAAEEIIVDRSASTTLPGINTQQESGPHTLFYYKDPSTGSVELEKLYLRVYKDGSVLEIYANNRFALSTRIYAETTIEQRLELHLTGAGEETATAAWENVQIWDIDTKINDVRRPLIS